MYFYLINLKIKTMKNSTKIIAAAVIGVVAGSVLGLLFAPDKGYEIRKKIAKQSGKIMGPGKEKMAKMKEKLENKLQKLNSKMESFSKEEPKQA